MDSTPEELAKLREEISKTLAAAVLPAEAQWLLEYRATDRIKKEVWRDLLFLLADSRLRDASSLSLNQKLILLETLHLNLIQAGQPLDRQLFSKKIRPALNLTREIFLDLQDIVNYQKNKKEKFRLGALRKYGPVKDAPYRNRLREDFAGALRDGNYAKAQEIILILNFRKNANRKGITKEALDRLEKELSAAAGELRLDIDWLKENFNADRPPLQSTYQPEDNKVNIIYKKLPDGLKPAEKC
ncbi:MAG: hypothetical protein LBD99_07255 [Candidatus Margulisbacteria bacterium]|jgi:hypothetical protein|nr:hypothetical protein [Candidatus Margulisiibacteriota bacterium]